jgi:hypothetical protein
MRLREYAVLAEAFCLNDLARAADAIRGAL